jgi:hypothetical protein
VTGSEELGEHWEYTGCSDLIMASRTLTRPDPSKADGSQPETAAWAGARETLLLTAFGCIGGITVPATQSRGTHATMTADWQTVLESLQSLCNREFAVDIVQQSDGALAVACNPIRDMSRTVGFTTDNGALKTLDVSTAPPTCTRCIVKSGGGDTARYTPVNPAAGAALEPIWGIHETLIDLQDGQTTQQAASDAVSGAISAMTDASGTLADDTALDGVKPGDLVGVRDGPDTWITTNISSITTGFTDGVIQTATLGDMTALQSRLSQQHSILDARRRIARLERRQS